MDTRVCGSRLCSVNPVVAKGQMMSGSLVATLLGFERVVPLRIGQVQTFVIVAISSVAGCFVGPKWTP